MEDTVHTFRDIISSDDVVTLSFVPKWDPSRTLQVTVSRKEMDTLKSHMKKLGCKKIKQSYWKGA